MSSPRSFRSHIETAFRVFCTTKLYGSKVSGQDTDESDIDLLVLTQHSLPWQERNAITNALFDIELAYDVVISTLVVAQTDWLTGYYTLLPIHHEIAQQGVAA